MLRVSAEAPTRIDLCGGTIDLWPIHQILENRATVNVGITLPAQVTLTELAGKEFHLISHDQRKELKGPFATVAQAHELALLGLILKYVWDPELPALKIETTAKSPAGAGLGGSSCLAVTMLYALYHFLKKKDGRPLPNEQKLVATAQDIEAQIIFAPTGCQDYWGAVRGGINCLTYPPGETCVDTYTSDKFSELNAHLIICYSGHSRASAINNWEIFKRVFDRDAALLNVFQEIGSLSLAAANAVKHAKLNDLMEISKLEWELRKKLWPNIETTVTRQLDEAAKNAGAVFSRVCGAGGGGVMAVFAPPSSRKKVEAALTQAGGQVLAAHVSDKGLRLIDGE